MGYDLSWGFFCVCGGGGGGGGGNLSGKMFLNVILYLRKSMLT